jgi:hypothetical protein
MVNEASSVGGDPEQEKEVGTPIPTDENVTVESEEAVEDVSDEEDEDDEDFDADLVDDDGEEDEEEE